MDRIMNILKKIREDKKLSTIVVSVLCMCLVAVVALFVCLPELKAAENDVDWDPEASGEFLMSNLPDGNNTTMTTTTLDIPANTVGNPYIIDGTGASKTNISIILNYTGTTGDSNNPQKVYVKLVNVNVTQTLDYSVIRYTTEGAPVEFVVTVQGECSMESTVVGAKTPLWEVVDTSYELYRLKDPETVSPTLESYITVETHGKQVGLILQGETPTSTLTLTNAAGSYGTLIGSSEAATFANESTTGRQTLLNKLNGLVMSDGEITVTDDGILQMLKDAPYKFTEFNYQYGVFQPQYKYKSTKGVSAGEITIGGENGQAPLVLTLNHSGYGAAIGGGGSENPGGLGVDSGKITINNGTITVTSNPASAVSPVFGTGLAKDAQGSYGEHGGVVINGGSLNFRGYTNQFGNTIPINKDGQKLYLVPVDTMDLATNKSIQNIDEFIAGQNMPITYKPDSSLQFDVNLSGETQSLVKGPDGNGDLLLPIKALSVDVTVSPTAVYSYVGTGHPVGNDKDYLYFWLPATQTTSFTITDEFGVGYTDFILKIRNGSGNLEEVDPISTDKNSSDSRKYVLTRGATYYLIATNIPSNLRVKNVALSTGGNAPYDAARGYQIIVGADTASIVADVSYAGNIEIVYDDGLVAGDEVNHDVTMPTFGYEYGTESYELPDLGKIYKTSQDRGQLTDIIFSGWVYTDANGQEMGTITHIVKGNTFDFKRNYTEIVQPDGKIYVKAKWKITIEYVIGADATLQGGIPTMEVTYIYGTNNVIDVTLTQLTPFKESFAFMGWTLDDDTTTLYEYTAAGGASNILQLSTLTSHVFYANYERSGFGIYIDASALDQNFANLSCISGTNGAEMLVKNNDGSLATTVVDGKTYYYTGIVKKGTEVSVLINTIAGYIMVNPSISVTGSEYNNTSVNSIEGKCVVRVGDKDIYITTTASFDPVEYEIKFMDGKTPNDALWGSATFTYSIEDIVANKTIGDIIRKGLGKSSAEMSDADIAAYINTIPKNNRFTDFSGWTHSFYQGEIAMNKTIASIYAETTSISYGPMTFTANWTEYDKFLIDVSLFEREYYSDGSHRDRATDMLVPVLYYYSGGSNKMPIYTEQIIDNVTGEEKTVAYAKTGDKVEIALFRKNANGNPYGEPVVDGIKLEELYYKYESKVDDASIRADIEGSNAFTIKDDVKDDTVINVYVAFSLKKYNIIYWDLRGCDNSANPNSYTIFDEIEFEPIADGVDWLLVCADEDSTNNDDVTTEVIYKILPGGKLVTNGLAGNRDYTSNLILMPDWAQYSEDSYSIRFEIENDALGTISIIYPDKTSEFYGDELIVLSVDVKDGYKLVPNSLKYRKEGVAPSMRAFGQRLLTRELDTYIIAPVDEESGIYLFTMPSSDVVISAEFEICQYNILYSDITADVINRNPDVYNVNSDITLLDPVRDGYLFLGWFDKEGNQVTRIIDRTGDLILTPKFELIEVTEPEEPDNGGSGNESEKPDNEKPSDEKPSDENSENEEPDNGSSENKPGAEDGTTGDEGATEDKPGTGNVGNQGSAPGIQNKPDTDINGGVINGVTNNKPSDGNGTTNGGSATIAGRPSNVVSRPLNTIVNNSKPSTNVQTGDETNVPRLILICAAAVLILMIVVIKKPADKDKSDEE